MNLRRIALTGGPCGGKTETAKQIRRRLRLRGIPSYIVPEPASALFHPAGVPLDLSDLPESARYAIQKAIFRTHLAVTREIEAVATALHPGQDVVILCDRWLADGKAYDNAVVARILQEEGWSDDRIHSECELVVVLQSPAVDAPERFSRANNEARIETDLTYTAELDRRTRQAWEGHPNRYVIPNTESDGVAVSFEEKVDRAYALVCARLFPSDT